MTKVTLSIEKLEESMYGAMGIAFRTLLKHHENRKTIPKKYINDLLKTIDAKSGGL